MFKWIQGKIGMLTGHIAGELAANKVLTKVAGDQVGALQASFFHTLSNADEAIFECVKGELYDQFVTQGATPAQATTKMREFEEYLANLEDWQAILFRLTVVTETTATTRLEILGRMFHDTSKNARDRIIQNIVGDEPVTHRVCEHVKKHYQAWAIWFIAHVMAAALALKQFALHTVPAAIVRAAKATDAALNTHVAPKFEATLTAPNTGWVDRLNNLGEDIKNKGGL